MRVSFTFSSFPCFCPFFFLFFTFSFAKKGCRFFIRDGKILPWLLVLAPRDFYYDNG